MSMNVKQLINSLQSMLERGQIKEDTTVLLNTYDDCMYEVICVEPLGDFCKLKLRSNKTWILK
ncbi:hypothetical protein ABD75_04165 [Bacillus vallismortis]|nr:hypothetical protein [Bacillus vallismortis]QAV08705.1 hypothetical protein BV11031_08935 [Bacillus vallismortis]